MNSKTSGIIFLVITLTVFPAFGQEVLIEETPDISIQQESWGPNRDNYIQFIMYRGQYIPVGGLMLDTKTIQNQSGGIQLQYKRKLNNLFSFLIEAVYNADQFGFSCDKPSQLNGATNYDKELLKMHSAGLNVLLRINFDKKRGNHLGKYLELGLFANYLITSNHIAYYEGTEGVDKFNKVRVTESGLNYINPFQYGILMRIGSDKYGLFYRSRYTDWITDPTINSYLPKHQLGLSYSLTD
ncbi:MAG: hypothetical protein U9N86_11900 [Bacteroidota bacterium]|nr:hypothetical protein [Bacteroidota bacterium]